jgi:hypothetical protein
LEIFALFVTSVSEKKIKSVDSDSGKFVPSRE